MLSEDKFMCSNTKNTTNNWTSIWWLGSSNYFKTLRLIPPKYPVKMILPLFTHLLQIKQKFWIQLFHRLCNVKAVQQNL